MLALLAFTGGGVAAWLLTSEQVRVTIAPDSAGALDPDAPIARLEERVGVLETDLRGLAAALQSNLAALDTSWQERGDARAAPIGAALQRVEAVLAELRARPAGADGALGERLAAIERAVGALRAQPGSAAVAATAAAAGAAEESAPAVSTPVAVESPPPPAADVAAAPASTAVAEPTGGPAPQTAGEPAPRRASFLAFQLPSDDFRFDERRTWSVIASLSRVGFDARSTLHDFSGATSKLSGELTADLAHPGEAPTARIVVDATGLTTGLDDRDDAMREHLDTAAHRDIAWTMTGFAARRIDVDAQRIEGDATGALTIRGVTRELTMPVQMSIDGARRLVIDGQAPLRLSDYGVPVPNKLGVIAMEDEVTIWIALRARPAPRGAASAPPGGAR